MIWWIKMELNYTGPHCHGAAAITIQTQGVKFRKYCDPPPPVSYQACWMTECCHVLNIYWCTPLLPTCVENSCIIAERWHYEVFLKEITCVFGAFYWLHGENEILLFKFVIQYITHIKHNTPLTLAAPLVFRCLSRPVFSARACWAALAGDDGRHAIFHNVFFRR